MRFDIPAGWLLTADPETAKIVQKAGLSAGCYARRSTVRLFREQVRDFERPPQIKTFEPEGVA